MSFVGEIEFNPEALDTMAPRLNQKSLRNWSYSVDKKINVAI